MLSVSKYYFIFFLMLNYCFTAFTQSLPQPVARYMFNEKKVNDEISNAQVYLHSAVFTRDRFNNEASAIFLAGNQYSYINLGNSPNLKFQTGSISLWVNIETRIYAGRGHTINPVIVAKNQQKENFYEAYCIYYSPQTDRLYGTCTKDSSIQVTVFSEQTIKLSNWHHMVLSFNDDSLKFYMDGKLQGVMQKHFTSVYSASDSVLIGYTGNSKNNERFTQATFDDIEYFNVMLNDNQVKELYEAPNPNKNKILLTWLLWILGFFVLCIIVYMIVRQRIRRHILREEKRFADENLILETELRVNRALMNPHFVFNSLNALQNFILKNENERANYYLVKFSKLIRKILEVNMTDIITLETEIELLNRYLEIEDLRFEEDIKHEILLENEIIPTMISIPIMMLQPFVENAIWHGLLKKEGEKKLVIRFSVYEAIYLQCVIEDNGIGRNTELTDVFQKKSLATGFVIQRLELLNKLHHIQCSLRIEDLPEGSGTRVTILLPILNRLN